MSSLNNILSRSSIAARNTASTSKLVKQMNESGSKLSTGNKYLNLADMDADGIRKTVDSARREITKISYYKTTIAITEPKLSTQSKALTDIKSTLTEFNSSIVSVGPLTKAEISNRALTKLTEILNRRNDREYIFGGKNSLDPPLTEDIINKDNRVDGQITSKYTDVSEDMSQINITDDISVRANRLHAGSSGIQEMIEMLHFFKDPNTSQGTIISEVSSKFIGVQKSIDSLVISVNTDLEIINGTTDKPGIGASLSDQEAIANTTISDLTNVDIVSEGSNFKALSISAVTNMGIASTRNDLLSQFAQTIRS